MVFGLATKRHLNSELEKIRQGFKERDERINKLHDKHEATALKLATIEGILLNHSLKSQASQSLQVSSSLKPNKETFETKLIKRIKTNKKALVMAEILKLYEATPTNELFNNIVLERGLCSKASFYRYIDSLKSQGYETSETYETLKHKTHNKK